MPEHLDNNDHCQRHGDHSRRIDKNELDINSLRSCQSKIKVDVTTVIERSTEAHRRIGETNVSHNALVERVGKMNERFDDRDRDQDKRINKLSVQIAGLVALVQTLMFAVEHLFAK